MPTSAKMGEFRTMAWRRQAWANVETILVQLQKLHFAPDLLANVWHGDSLEYFSISSLLSASRAAGGGRAEVDDGCRGQQHLLRMSSAIQARCRHLVQASRREQP